MAIDVSTLGWGVVQDRHGDARSGVAYSIVDAAGAEVLKGTTNANGEIVGSLAAGDYTLSIGGVTKTVTVPMSGTGPARIVNTSTSHALQIQNLTTGDSNCEALDIVSTNESDTTLGIRGRESGRGTIKVTHQKPDGIDDPNASAISIVLGVVNAAEQTAAQGIFLDAPAPGTTGKLMQLRNSGTTQFYVGPDGTLFAKGPVGFNGTAPPAKPNVTGSRGGNAALASLLTALASTGLISDGTSA